MTAFAQTLQRQQQEAAAIQTSERTKRRVVRRSPVVVEPLEPAESPDEQYDHEHHEQLPFEMPAVPTAEPAVLPLTVATAPPPSGSNSAPVQETAASTGVGVGVDPVPWTVEGLIFKPLQRAVQARLQSFGSRALGSA